MFNCSFESFAHIPVFVLFVFFIDFTIRKCDIALKTTLLVPLLKLKSSEVQNGYNCNSDVPEHLNGGLQEHLPYTSL